MRIQTLAPYFAVAAALAGATFFGSLGLGESVIHLSHEGTEGHLGPMGVALAVMCTSVLFASWLARKSGVPVYVMLLILGVAFSSFMEPLRANAPLILALLAGLVLGKAGLETDLKDLKATGLQVLSMSFIGLIITAVLFSGTLLLLGPWFGTPISAAGANLTGAAIASTDPAAIVPTLGALVWLSAHANRVKTTAISESAGTDVTGALTVAALIPIAAAGTMTDLLSTGYGSLLSTDSAVFLGWQLGGGLVGGLVGFGLLWFFQKIRSRSESVVEGSLKDMLAFAAAIIAAFVVASVCYGNVFLATFLAGLFFNVEEHLHHAHHDYDEKIDNLVIPFIFVLGGLLVDIDLLWQYAGLGIASALILIFGIRYIAVIVSLLPFLKIEAGGSPMNTWADIKFLATVRQIGAIGIVLAANIASRNIPGTESVVPLTAWAAIITLLICTMRVGTSAIQNGLAEEAK